MKSSRIRTTLVALLCGTSFSHADILVMKDGSRVEGNILQENDQAVRMRYRLTPKIWDEKNFMRDDIQEVIKQSPEEVELIELRKLLPTADLMTADQYEQIIQNRLRPFVNKYTGTKEAKEAEGMIGQLQEEKAKVSGGQVKLEGKWLSPEESQAEQFNIQAYRSLERIRAHIAASKWTEALREFDAFLREGPALRATKYYPEIVAEVLTALDKRADILAAMANEQPALKKDREEGLRKLEASERARAKAGIDKELAAWRADVQTARTNRARWIEPYKYDAPSIQASQKEVVAEQQRLQALDLASIKVQNEAFGAVLAKIGQKDYAGGYQAFQQVAHLANNPTYRDITDDLQRRLRSLYDELLTKQRASGSSLTRGTSAIGGQSSTEQDELIKRILEETNNPAGAPPAGAPPAGTAPAGAPPAGAPPAQAPAAPAPAGAPAAAPTTPATPAPAAQ